MQSKDSPSALSKNLHAIHQQTSERQTELVRDVGCEELGVLADASLGPDYDRAKIAMVMNLQQLLHREQESLARQLNSQHVTRKEYFEQLNVLLRRIYSQCEKVLGSGDFEKLFGAPLSEVDHMVDADLFLGGR